VSSLDQQRDGGLTRHLFTRIAAFVLVPSVVFVAVEVLWPWGPLSAGVTALLVRGSCTGLAGWFCFARSRREPGRTGQGWLLLGLGLVVAALAHLGFVVVVLMRHTIRVPDAVPPDVLGAIAPGFIVVGLLLLAGRSSASTKLLTLLDSLIITLSCLSVGWVLSIGSVPPRTSFTRTVREVIANTPTTLMLLVALALVIAMRWQGDLVTLGLLTVAFAWADASVIAGNGDPATRLAPAPGIHVGLFATPLLIALAAARPCPPQEPELAERRRQWRLEMALPTLSAVAVVISVGVRLSATHTLEPSLTWLTVTVMLLITLRQYLTLTENRSLTLHLERRVEERTSELTRTQQRFASLVQNSSDVIAVVDADGQLSYTSPAMTSVLGYAEGEVLGRAAADLIHPEDRAATLRVLTSVGQGDASSATVGCRLRHRDGGWRHVEAAVSGLRDDPASAGLVLNLRDITDRRALEDLLHHEALHDSLTSLANRRLFAERVRHAAERTSRTGEELAVLFIDLDGFKQINDSAGHSAGDQVLMDVSERLHACLRPADTAARLGGDEFAVLLEDTAPEHAAETAQRIVDNLAGVRVVGGRKLRMGASVGVVSATGVVDIDALLRDADVAMYQAKASGRGRYAVFHPRMREQLIAQLELETALQEAIERQRLRLLFQPIVDLATGHIRGVEALVRWTDARHGTVPPSLFIPLAERSDLIVPLDVWVLSEAAAKTVELQRFGPRHRDLTVNVNLSAHHLRQPGLARNVASALQHAGLAPEHLVLEITETAVLPDPDTVLLALQSLHRLGVQISLDDFGTGYSPLTTLERLPVDEIKIDRSFVDSLGSGPRSRRLVGSIIDMAHALELHTVAEGVETGEQLRILRELRCATGQGYLFSPPLTPQELDRVLAELGSAVPV
jgi:diguanylate cyclase (GGDEF)-like protein/PAS domain S-box-containing protein